VAVPKEEAQMVDIGARPKKRGRPRKNPSVDPPDPHKGSVLYPGKGVLRTLWMGAPSWERGDQALIAGTGSVSWLRTEKERRRDP
jgi:hypothetical protein